MEPPPPPPPHGEGRKRGGLPDGNYDIFIIPPHMAGGGFLYLPSLRPNVNSFAAGFASALLLVFLYTITAPAFVAWWHSVKGQGGMMVVVILAVGVGAWAFGRTQTEGAGGGIPGTHPGAGPPPAGHGYSNAHTAGGTHMPGGGAGPMPGAGGYPGAGSMPRGAPGAGGPKPNTSWQHAPEPDPNTSWQRPPDPQPDTSWQRTPEPETPPPPRPQPQAAPPPRPQPQAAPPPPRPQPQAAPPPKAAPPPPRPSTAWERSKEETKRKEEERKAKEEERKAAEAAQRKKDEDERKRKELVEKMRQAREKEKAEREAREAREKKEKEAREAKEAREKKEKEARERWEKEAREKKEKEAAELKSRGTSYAFSTVGEKTSLWPGGRPPVVASQPAPPKTSPVKPTPPPPTAPRPTARPSPTPSPTKEPPKRPPFPTARTDHEPDEDAYSYRPYDKPRRPIRRPSQSSMFSESSYAPSFSTANTTPPPSRRGKYTNKDPDKIILKAVYSFNNTFIKTPSAQLVSGVGSVTDGLVLRITTEGLFIDDDVRDVPQREWDVKAWTLKLVEVWCPSFKTSSPLPPNERTPMYSTPTNKNPVRRLWDLEKDMAKDKAILNAASEAFVKDLVRSCNEGCSATASSPSPGISRFPSSASSSVYSASTQSSSSSHASSSYSDRSSSVGSSSPSDFASAASASAYNRNASRFGNKAGTGTNGNLGVKQGKWETKGLHVLRASIRDAEGKRFLFVLGREEAWKVVEGLARLKKGTQVRALGLVSMSDGDAKGTLEGLGWGY